MGEPLVVDADGHTMEPDDLWVERMDAARWGDWVPRKVVEDEIYETVYVGGTIRVGGRELRDALARKVGKTPREMYELLQSLRVAGGHDPHARIADMDRDGIDVAVLYPSLALFFGPLDPIEALHDVEFVAACQRAYGVWAGCARRDRRRRHGRRRPRGARRHPRPLRARRHPREQCRKGLAQADARPRRRGLAGQHRPQPHERGTPVTRVRAADARAAVGPHRQHRLTRGPRARLFRFGVAELSDRQLSDARTSGPSPDAPRFLLYTSGSTADPKGVLHSDATLLAECAAQAEYHGLTPAEVFVMPSPVGHISGLLYGVLLPIWLGATSVLMPV